MCDRDSALRSVQKEVQRRREAPAILDTYAYGIGGNQANGAAEKVAQALGEQICVLRHGAGGKIGD